MKTKRDFNGAAHFLLGLSMVFVALTIVSNSINIGNYKYFGWSSSILIKEIIIDALILCAGILTFMKKRSGLIALVILFIVRMFVTIPWNSDTSIAYLLGGKTADLIRDFAPFAIAMCFKKNGISGWNSMMASEEFVTEHTILNAAPNESETDQGNKSSDLISDDFGQGLPDAEEDSVSFTVNDYIPEKDFALQSSTPEQLHLEKHLDEEKHLSNKPTKPISPGTRIGLASLLGIIVLFFIFAIIVAAKPYPDYISSYRDKWRYAFNLPNDNLVREMMKEAQPSNDGLYFVFTHPKYNSSVFESDKFYKIRVDALREFPGCTLYRTTRRIKSSSDLKENDVYVCRKDGELSVLEDNKEIIECRDNWLNNNALSVIYATEIYNSDAAIKKEMEIVDEAASLPVKGIDVVDLVGNYYEIEQNFSKASDYYQFQLKKHPHNTSIRGRFAYALYMGGNAEDARTAAERALSKDPKETKSLSTLALIESDNYNWGEVKKYAKKALDYGSEDSNVFYAYCEALYKQGEIKAAQMYYNKAYEAYRNNPRREKYADYAGCPFEIIALDLYSSNDTKVVIPTGEKLLSSKCCYIMPEATVNVLRFDAAEVGVKIYKNGTLRTGGGSKNGYTYTETIDGLEPGKHIINISGWGSNSPGTWPKGEYSLEIWYNEQKIGEDTFQIY